MSLPLFVDTEFTDFLDCDLISIAIVSADGREFYGERSDFDQGSCSEFGRAAVLPQLGQYPGQVFAREELRTALLSWLDQFSIEGSRECCISTTAVTGNCWSTCSVTYRQAGRPAISVPTYWTTNKLKFI
ncbi:hypothetical protein [Burkholderia diffusa]|uniref:hypothetical protein n=1 Tax=Burkholderia diffusa TaxID=488732 RepID=UPI000757CDF5|nr:hypothetical protein [Burkholderia diffusa]KVH48393.1 hypothetical protein WJ39_13850 [Burkholderia diffusa]